MAIFKPGMKAGEGVNVLNLGMICILHTTKGLDLDHAVLKSSNRNLSSLYLIDTVP